MSYRYIETYIVYVNPHKDMNPMHLLYVHFKGGGDERLVELVPAAVEAFGVGVGPTCDCGLSGGNYREDKTKEGEDS